MDYIKTSREVARMLNCTQRNVSHLVKSDKLKPISILENGNFLFNAKDVEYYLKSCTDGK